MKVVLINPPAAITAMFGPGRELIQKYEPLGLLSIAAVVRDAGHQVTVIDAHVENLEADTLQQRLRALAPEVVGVSVLTSSGEFVYHLGQWVKRTMPHATVVLGNLHASVFADAYLRNGCCDAVVHGEGEEVLLNLINAIKHKTDWHQVDSISFRDAKGQVITTGPPAIVTDLTSLPFPARDLVDQRRYQITTLNNHIYIPRPGEIARTMITSRGCFHRCRFCAVHSGTAPRFAAPERVVDEIEELVRNRGVSYIFFMDSLFIADRNRILAICEEIQKRQLKFSWGCDGRVDYLNPEIVRAMAAAGCYEMSLGIESGVQRLLDGVRKGLTLEQVQTGIRTVREHSTIRLAGLFILGLPGESEADSKQTIEFAVQLPLDFAQFSVCVPYPGSALFDDLVKLGELETGVQPDGSVDPGVWIRYTSYLNFTELKPIWVTPGMTATKLRALQRLAVRRFFLRPRMIRRNINRLHFGNLLATARIAWRGFF